MLSAGIIRASGRSLGETAKLVASPDNLCRRDWHGSALRPVPLPRAGRLFGALSVQQALGQSPVNVRTLGCGDWLKENGNILSDARAREPDRRLELGGGYRFTRISTGSAPAPHADGGVDPVAHESRQSVLKRPMEFACLDFLAPSHEPQRHPILGESLLRGNYEGHLGPCFAKALDGGLAPFSRRVDGRVARGRKPRSPRCPPQSHRSRRRTPHEAAQRRRSRRRSAR